jgi:predicted RNase H-like nuclease (RuvC/YqgF family)
LQQQAQEQTKLITDFQQQVAQLQGQLQSRMTEQAAQQSSYKSLQQQLQEQAHEVASLREQLAQLRPLATIGEAQLNKWRSRNFSR